MAAQTHHGTSAHPCAPLRTLAHPCATFVNRLTPYRLLRFRDLRWQRHQGDACNGRAAFHRVVRWMSSVAGTSRSTARRHPEQWHALAADVKLLLADACMVKLDLYEWNFR